MKNALKQQLAATIEQQLLRTRERYAYFPQPTAPKATPVRPKRRKRKPKPAALPKPRRERAFPGTYKYYVVRVRDLTNAQDLSGVPGIEKRAFREWDLDHIVSVKEGWRLRIPPELLAGVENVQMLPHQENMTKGRRSDWHLLPPTSPLHAFNDKKHE